MEDLFWDVDEDKDIVDKMSKQELPWLMAKMKFDHEEIYEVLLLAFCYHAEQRPSFEEMLKKNPLCKTDLAKAICTFFGYISNRLFKSLLL